MYDKKRRPSRSVETASKGDWGVGATITSSEPTRRGIALDMTMIARFGGYREIDERGRQGTRR